MNKRNGIFVVVGVLLGVTLLLYYVDPFSGTPENLSKDEQRGLLLLRTAQETCLAGKTLKAGMRLDFSTDLKTKLTGGSGAEKINAKGAVNYLDEGIRSIQDKEIRDCLQRAMPQINACLMGNCGAVAQPKTIDFQFTYQPNKETENLLEKNKVRFNLEFRNIDRDLTLQPGGYYVDTIGLMEEKKQFTAGISGVPRDGHQTPNALIICLERSPMTSPTDSTHTKFICQDGKSCQHDGVSPKWLGLCSKVSFQLPYVKYAFADDRDYHWSVPSLETLDSRKRTGDLIGVGYTRFTLTSVGAVPIDADAFYFDITVNGRKVYINGLPGSFNAKAHDFSRPLPIEFGLQNLNFSGVNNGCDEISLKLQYLKRETPVGNPISFERSYVALRDARVKDFQRNDATYRWSGKYIRASREYDSEVFATSTLVSRNLDFQANQQAMEKAKRDISKSKTDFDKLGLIFEGRRVVGVIRPPLTMISYGLAAGIVEETKQIRFTYSIDTARRLEQFLISQRGKGINYERVIDRKPQVYSVRVDRNFMASPPVCHDDVL